MKHFLMGLIIGTVFAGLILFIDDSDKISTSLVQQDTTVTEFVHSYEDTTEIYLTHTDTVTIRDTVDVVQETFQFDDQYFSGSIIIDSPSGIIGSPALNIDKAPMVTSTVALRHSIGLSSIVSKDFAAVLGSYHYQHSRYGVTGYVGYSTVGVIGGAGISVSF